MLIYGPYHFPEKLILLMCEIVHSDKHFPVYSEGLKACD